MIPKNLKVGDTFVDEFKFRVVKVNEDGTYISERVNSVTPITEVVVKTVEKPIEKLEYSKTQVNRMPNSELEKVCKDLGLEVGTGTEMKRAIIAKLGL